MQKLYAIRYTLYATLCVLYIIVTHISFADIIYMQDESILKGLVVEEYHDRIIVSTIEGEVAVFRKDIDEIFFDELEQNYYYLANKFLNEADFESAERFYAKSLEINPSYKMSRRALFRLNDVRMKEIGKWKAKDMREILKNQLGISILKKDDFFKIKEVSAKNSQLQMDDAIVAVWDESVKFMNEETVAKKIIGMPDTIVGITIQRNVKLRLECIPWYFKIFGKRKAEVFPILMEPDGLTVGKLAGGSQAARAGLMHGDRILAIDGRPTRYISLEEVKNLIRADITGEVEFTIERNLRLTRAK